MPQVAPAASSTAAKKAPATAAAVKKPAGAKPGDAQPGGKKKDSEAAERAPPEVDPVAEAEAARLKAE